MSTVSRPKGRYTILARRDVNLTFCVGAPRSGTTLMGSLLCEGADAFPMLPECTFMTQLIRQFHDIVEYADAPRFQAYAKSKDELVRILSPAIHGFVDNALSHFSQLDGRELVLKDPELTLYLDHLTLFFTNFKAICVVRDPRKVIASMRAVFEKQGRSADFENLISMIFNYYWRASESGLARSGSLHFVDFNRVLAGDSGEFSALEEFLGYRVGRRGFGKTFFDFDRSDATYSENYGQPRRFHSEPAHTLNEQESARVQYVFSGYNTRYAWW
ncbi:MAG: sulfotransferase [Proteobacteria bacterium]|nr:sulfotransferase [Pseudomonadota bacterium]